jgi:hypothetical protein
MNFVRIRNETSIGSIAAFALDVDGRLYGLSAAHVLLGENKDADPYDVIKIRNTETNRWINAGVLVKSVYSNGLDMFSDFGAIDAGIFELNREFKNKIKNELKPLKHSKYLQGNPKALEGKTLYSYSPMQDKKIRATVEKLFYKTSNKFPRKFDLVLENVDSGELTKKGDSGIVWKDASGRAVAMHIRGDKHTNRFSYGTFINRVTKSLDIRLLHR